MPDERDAKEPLPKATPVTVGMRDPYPTGSPTGTVIADVKRAQELTHGPDWAKQSEANLLAGGMIAGGAQWTP